MSPEESCRIMRPPFLHLAVLLALMPGVASAMEGPQLLWEYQTTDSILSVYTDGGHVIANSLTHVYFLDASGNLLWKVLKSDGNIEVSSFSAEQRFAAAAGRFLYLFNESGVQTNKTLLMNIKAIAISQDGSKMVIGSFSPAITLLDNKGTPLWIFMADNGVTGVAISRDGEYVVGNSKTSIYFLRDGELRWRYRANESISAASMDGEGRYVVAAGREHLYLFDADGKILWTLDAEGPEKVSMSRDGEYIAFNTGDKLVFMGGGGEKLWVQNISSISSISLAPDGDYVAVGRIDRLSGSSIAYHRTILRQPPKTPAPTQGPPPAVREETGDRTEGQAQKVEEPRELEKPRENISAAATPPPTPLQPRGICGPVSLLLFALIPLGHRRLLVIRRERPIQKT